MCLDEQLTIFVSVFVTTYSIIRIFRSFADRETAKRFVYPPSLPSLPLIGSLPFLRNFKDLSALFMKMADQFGSIFTFRVGSKLILVLNTREVIEEAFVKNSRSFSSRPGVYADKCSNPNSRPKGITLVAESPERKRNHQVALTVLKEFGFGVKSLMEDRILNEIEAMVTYIRERKGRAFRPGQLSILVTSNINSDIVLGHRNNYDLGISELTTEIGRYFHDIDMAYDIAPFLRYIPSYKEKLKALTESGKKIHAIIEAEIDGCIKNETNCFVYRYVLKQGTNYDREQLNFVIRDMLIGGTETTSTTFQWLLVALANNQHIQKKLHSEIDSVIPKGRFPTLKDQSRLPYHEATILEIYRWRILLYLPVAHQSTADCEFQRYFIPKGTIVLPNLRAVHNNKAVWVDPDEFRPERFLDQDNNIIGRERVIPFGLGNRSCFGEQLARMETFLLVTSISQRFIVLPPEGQEKIRDTPHEPVTVSTMPELFSIRLLERI